VKVTPPPPAAAATDKAGTATGTTTGNVRVAVKDATLDELEAAEEKKEAERQAIAAEALKKKGPISWRSVGLLVVVGTGVIAFYQYDKARQLSKPRQGPSIGKAALGGPFKLIDLEGKTVTEKDLLGKYALIYFGFASCPDICPAELIKMKAAIAKAEALPFMKDNMKIQPVFITIDPRRDTVARLTEYSKDPTFHSRTMWLTGSEEDIAKVAKKFRVYYSAPDDADTSSDYLVDHSIFFYLMDPAYELLDFYGKQFTQDEVALKMSNAIRKHEEERS
jgi:protein SCO1/2